MELVDLYWSSLKSGRRSTYGPHLTPCPPSPKHPTNLNAPGASNETVSSFPRPLWLLTLERKITEGAQYVCKSILSSHPSHPFPRAPRTRHTPHPHAPLTQYVYFISEGNKTPATSVTRPHFTCRSTAATGLTSSYFSSCNRPTNQSQTSWLKVQALGFDSQSLCLYDVLLIGRSISCLIWRHVLGF